MSLELASRSLPAKSRSARSSTTTGPTRLAGLPDSLERTARGPPRLTVQDSTGHLTAAASAE